jgi:hypothetical protein
MPRESRSSVANATQPRQSVGVRARQETSHPAPTRFGRVRQFEIDRANPKDGDYDRLSCPVLHSVEMPPMGNTPDEASGRFRVEFQPMM